MVKTVEINITTFSEDEAFDLDFDISSYLMEMDIRHTIASLGSKLVFTIDDIDIIIYNRFIGFLKKNNLDFKEV